MQRNMSYINEALLEVEREKNKKCSKCRTKDFKNCHSIECPMREKYPEKCSMQVENTLVKSTWDLREYFKQLRFDKGSHLGLGDIRLTIAKQEDICDLVERFYKKKK